MSFGHNALTKRRLLEMSIEKHDVLLRIVRGCFVDGENFTAAAENWLIGTLDIVL
jgi:hypothetical protein